jgi:hypothetical protein
MTEYIPTPTHTAKKRKDTPPTANPSKKIIPFLVISKHTHAPIKGQDPNNMQKKEERDD